MAGRPKATNSLAEQELDKAQDQFEQFEENIKELTVDRMKSAPLQEVESQTKISQRDIEKSKDIYLKPKTTFPSREKFNEKFREEYNFAKEYVQFIAENKELIGDSMTLWTKPFPGCPAEEWVVPANKPIWGPRYLAERLRGCQYSILTMDESQRTSQDSSTEFFGRMVISKKVNRLTAEPVSSRKSVFMGANGF